MMIRDIHQLIKDQTSFAICRLPNSNKLSLYICDKPSLLQDISSLSNIQEGEFFMISPFLEQCNHDKLQTIILDNKLDLEQEEIQKWLEKSIEAEECLHQNKYTFDLIDDNIETYKNSFNKFKLDLENKLFSKLVLSRRCDYELPKNVPLAYLFKRGLEKYPTAFVYLCYSPFSGIWFGCSPELLLSGKQSIWQTVSLAGTRTKKSGVVEWDSKNIKEQRIVTDFINEVLIEAGVKSKLSESTTQQSGHLEHIKTNFEFELPDNSNHQKKSTIIKLISNLSPTPAVLGFPKKEAVEYFKNGEEGYCREFYSGVIGCFQIKQYDIISADLYVNLRCMKINDNKLSLFAGGGLLQSSNFETELQETKEKMHVSLSLFQP